MGRIGGPKRNLKKERRRLARRRGLPDKAVRISSVARSSKFRIPVLKRTQPGAKVILHDSETARQAFRRLLRTR